MRDQTLLLTSYVQSAIGRLAALLMLLLMLCLLVSSKLQAAPIVDLPAAFGTVVYQSQGDAARQLFIIANGHRSTVSGDNGVDTVQAQVETFQIGEWLIRSRHAALLFPEGFFGRRSADNPGALLDGLRDDLFDGETLTRSLADTSRFVNAELLLHKHYGIDLQQVEDRELYLNIRDTLISRSAGTIQEEMVLSRRLESLQKRRSAVLLQSAAQHSQASDSSANTILTIGLAHLGDILEFVEAGRINIPAAQIAGSDLPELDVPMSSNQSPVGITIIIPHSLLDRLPPELNKQS